MYQISQSAASQRNNRHRAYERTVVPYTVYLVTVSLGAIVSAMKKARSTPGHIHRQSKRKHGVIVNGDKVNTTKKKTNHAPKKPRWDEEIESDDGLFGDNLQDRNLSLGQEKESEYTASLENNLDDARFPQETEEEIRVRVAKQFLKQLKAREGTREGVSQSLNQEVDKFNNRCQYYVADKISVRSSYFLKGHQDAVTCVAVDSNTCSTVFTGSKDCAIIAWDLTTEKKTVFSGKRKNFNCGGHFERILDIAVTPDGRTVASVGGDHVIRVWDTRTSTSKCVSVLHGHNNVITGVCVDPGVDQARRLYSVGEDKSLKVWNLEVGCCEETFFGHTETPTCIDILNTQRPVTGGADATVRVWKTATNSHVLFNAQGEVVDAVSQLNQHRTISGHQNGSLMLWSVSNRKPVSIVKNAHMSGSWITAVGCLRYSDAFFSGSDDGSIRMWKVYAERHMRGDDTMHTKKTTKITAVPNVTIPAVGFVNKIVTSSTGEFVFAAVGKEHRLGRWKCIKEAKNGLLVGRLDGSIDCTTPVLGRHHDDDE